MTGADPKFIYQEVLDVLSDAIMTGNAPTALARTKLPHLRRTQSSETIVETEKDLINGLLTFGDALKGLGTTNLVRLVVEAEFLSENYISGYHMTHILQDAKPVMASYANRMVIVRNKGVWKMLEVDSMLNNLRWPIYIPRVRQDEANKIPPPLPENDARKQSSSPLDTYQHFIDDLSLASNQDDFHQYCSHLMFPYSSHTDTSDTVIPSAEQVRPFFEMLRDTIKEKHCNRIIRRAHDADFVSSDLICGYHTTEFCADDVPHFGPIKSRMLLQRKGTNWYLKSVTNSLQNSSFPYHVPQPSNALVTLRTIQERTRT